MFSRFERLAVKDRTTSNHLFFCFEIARIPQNLVVTLYRLGHKYDLTDKATYINLSAENTVVR